GIWPAPAWSTCPMMTYCTCSGATPARSSAAFMAIPPNSTAERSASEPRSRPMGVRAPATITEPDMTALHEYNAATVTPYPWAYRALPVARPSAGKGERRAAQDRPRGHRLPQSRREDRVL